MGRRSGKWAEGAGEMRRKGPCDPGTMYEGVRPPQSLGGRLSLPLQLLATSNCFLTAKSYL